MLPIFTADEMRRLDARAIAELGIPGASLMENAGRGAAEVIAAELARLGSRRSAAGKTVTVVCGKGGNGGDGFVVARWLKRRGVRPRVLLAVPARDIGGAAAGKLRELTRSGIRSRMIEDAPGLEQALADSDLVVDALLGTGARGPATGLAARAIDAINASGRPVVALDVPSGLPADGESPPGPAVRASVTATFAGLKRGLVMGAAVELAGRVEIVPIGIPPAEVARGSVTFLLEPRDIARLFPPRPRDAHKGTYGHLLLVAGSAGKTGAAALAAEAAMRSGGGLVTVATPASQQPIVASLIVEAMSEPLPETAARTIAAKAQEVVTELAASREAVAIGPGLGRDQETQQAVRGLVRDLDKPLALDADGLIALAGHLPTLRGVPAPRCLTPHPGEMATMLGTTTAEVQRDRIGCVRDFATTHGVHVVLKGARSVIGGPGGRVWVNPTGNPGMASGGTGDVLTGMLGAFLARGLDPEAALLAAVYLHGSAGDAAAARVGEESLVARDVIAAIPVAFSVLSAHRAP